ncbi:hypothetical protein BaRGS_00035245 [Batillaria attramentaria]|uniref:Uncharacterized protein n=1 Tax=Batillaria attramentaria TaxID=370345 RepID=A0ABD0JEZ0_9CAEN
MLEAQSLQQVLHTNFHEPAQDKTAKSQTAGTVQRKRNIARLISYMEAFKFVPAILKALFTSDSGGKFIFLDNDDSSQHYQAVMPKCLITSYAGYCPYCLTTRETITMRSPT